MPLGKDNKVQVNNGIIIWLDVDDVLVDFHALFNRLLRQRGFNIPVNFRPEAYSYVDIMSEKQFNRYFEELGAHWPSKVRVHPNAAEFTRKLKELGCRIILITSVDGTQAPERINNLCKHGIYFDELFCSRGRQKSEFAKELVPRYVDSQGNLVKSILIDDYAKNVIEFVNEVPGAVYGITLDVGYGQKWIKSNVKNKKILAKSKTVEELYDTTFTCVTKILTKKGNKRCPKA